MVCVACGRPTKGYSKCFACKSKEEREQSYDLGYQTGYLKGIADSPLQLDRKRWDQLRRLCHPDKHDNSPASNDAFQWLQTLEPKE